MNELKVSSQYEKVYIKALDDAVRRKIFEMLREARL
jgi:hypothetical protein